MEEDFREELIARQVAACAADMREVTAQVRRVTAKNEATLARLTGETVKPRHGFKRLQIVAISQN